MRHPRLAPFGEHAAERLDPERPAIEQAVGGVADEMAHDRPRSAGAQRTDQMARQVALPAMSATRLTVGRGTIGPTCR